MSIKKTKENAEISMVLQIHSLKMRERERGSTRFRKIGCISQNPYSQTWLLLLSFTHTARYVLPVASWRPKANTDTKLMKIKIKYKKNNKQKKLNHRVSYRFGPQSVTSPHSPLRPHQPIPGASGWPVEPVTKACLLPIGLPWNRDT